MDTIEILNAVYKPICIIENMLQKRLKLENLEFAKGYYNNHSVKDIKGDWVKEYFPIPVITIPRVCDIGIDINYIFVETKMKREDAIQFDFASLLPFKFEVYGVNEFLSDIYNSSMPINDICSKIEQSNEREIGINFEFAKEGSIEEIISLVHRLIHIQTFI